MTGHIAMPAPRSRLYLKLSDFRAGEISTACIEAAVRAGDVAALLVGAEVDAALKGGAGELMAVTRANDVALIIDRDCGLAVRLGADGVHVGGDTVDCRKAREALGDDGIVGVSPGASRHRAMELAEAGASYVGFEDDPCDPDGVGAWWAGIMEVPCVVHVGGGDEEVLCAVLAGMEFISPDETMWRSRERAVETVGRIDALIGKAAARA